MSESENLQPRVSGALARDLELRAKAEEFHLAGQHDQSSHGNWAAVGDEGDGDIPYDAGVASRINAARDEMQAELNRLRYQRNNRRITQSEYDKHVRDVEQTFVETRRAIQLDQVEDYNRPYTYEPIIGLLRSSVRDNRGNLVETMLSKKNAIRRAEELNRESQAKEAAKVAQAKEAQIQAAQAQIAETARREIAEEAARKVRAQEEADFRAKVEAEKARIAALPSGRYALLEEMKRQNRKITGSENQENWLAKDGAKIEAETDPIRREALIRELAKTYEPAGPHKTVAQQIKEAEVKYPSDSGGTKYVTIINENGVQVRVPEWMGKPADNPRVYGEKPKPPKKTATEIAAEKEKAHTADVIAGRVSRDPKEAIYIPEKPPVKVTELPRQPGKPKVTVIRSRSELEIEEVRKRNTIVIKQPKPVQPLTDPTPGRQVVTEAGKERYGESIGETIKPEELQPKKPTGKLSDIYKLSSHGTVIGPLARDMALRQEKEGDHGKE